MSEAIMELMQRAYADGPDDRTIIRKFRDVFKWDNLWLLTKKAGKEVRSFGWHKGIAAAAILVVTVASSAWFPVVAVAIGRPELIPLSTIFPDTPLLMGAESAARRFMARKRIENAIGGRVAYKNFCPAFTSSGIFWFRSFSPNERATWKTFQSSNSGVW